MSDPTDEPNHLTDEERLNRKSEVPTLNAPVVEGVESGHFIDTGDEKGVNGMGNASSPKMKNNANDKKEIVEGLGQAKELQGGMKNAIRTEEGQEADGKVKPKPRARLGDAEIVYLSDSDPEDEVYHDGEEEGEEGDWLKGYGDDTEDLQLQHLRLKTPTLLSLNLGRFKHLKRLCLRQNELISPLPPQALDGLEELEEIDLYDNRLGPVVEDEELKGCKNVTSLDLSFNNIRHPPTLPSMKQVNTLYLVQNKISHVEEGCLDWAAGSLKSLELGGNRIRAIENLDQLVLLEELWLGKNKIRILENLTTFTNLRILSLQSNRITKIQGLENLISLEELYLSHNGIKKIEGLEKNVKLTTLDIGNNMVEEIEGISHLVQLEEFWASNNQIQNLSALETQLSPLPNLTTVYLEGNPCQSNDVNYRRKVILALPQVQQVDATYVKVM